VKYSSAGGGSVNADQTGLGLCFRKPSANAARALADEK